jgi:predicted nucleic acid-binding protein
VSLAYFDTSALVKNYVQEAGSTRVRELLRAYEFLSSAIAPIEIHSVVRRRHSQGEITRPIYTAILSRVKQDRFFWQLVEPVPEVLAKAEEIAKDHNVRTLDAVILTRRSSFKIRSAHNFPSLRPMTDSSRRHAIASSKRSQ